MRTVQHRGVMTTVAHAGSFASVLRPEFRKFFTPRKNRYRMMVTQRPIRHCVCGVAFVQTAGRLGRYCPKCKASDGKRGEQIARRKNKLLRKFGISWAEYETMFLLQGGVCAICKKPEQQEKRLAVDHCHDTGKVRGLLCSMCNTAIGKLNDSVELLQRAIEYLEGRT